jgi:hypothetical protein
MEITLNQYKKVLEYQPETGNFIWLESRGKAKKGSIAGTPDKNGYIQIRYLRKAAQAHRLVFLYMTGEWPVNQVDHINRVTNDNRWINLRQADSFINMRNRGIQKNNTSGCRGVTYNKAQKKWKVEVKYKHQSYFIGYYKEKKDAIKASYIARVLIYGEI